VNRARLEALRPFKEQITAYLGGGKWLHEMTDELVRLGVPNFKKNGFGTKKAMQLLGFLVADNGRVTPRPRFRVKAKKNASRGCCRSRCTPHWPPRVATSARAAPFLRLSKRTA
jgi:hypothetical protein